MRLIPRDEGFFDLFAEIATRIGISSKLLSQLLAEPGRRDHHAAAIKNVEHEADRLTHEVILRLNRSFVTPIDREDIHLLASKLDNVIDLIDGTARRATMFHISESKPRALALADVLMRCATHIERGVAAIKRVKDVQAEASQIRTLEEEGDVIYTQAVGELFAGAPDPLEVIKWKEMYDTLEKAVDGCQDVANVMESVALKNS